MPRVTITRRDLLQDRQGRTFADVLDYPEQPLDAVLEFFNNEGRQRRMLESELHHDRPPLAGVVRELESLPVLDGFLMREHPSRTKRLRQAIGVVVRMIMDGQGWKKTGKKGSLGVRTPGARHNAAPGSHYNTGGLAFWFLRAERYQCLEGMPYPTVRSRARKLAPPVAKKPRKAT